MQRNVAFLFEKGHSIQRKQIRVMVSNRILTFSENGRVYGGKNNSKSRAWILIAFDVG